MINVGGQGSRVTVGPGECWPEHVGAIAGSESCAALHFQYHVSGRLHIG